MKKKLEKVEIRPESSSLSHFRKQVNAVAATSKSVMPAASIESRRVALVVKDQQARHEVCRERKSQPRTEITAKRTKTKREEKKRRKEQGNSVED